MLSVVSIVLMSKHFRRDSGPAMGSYALLLTILMAAGVVIVLERVSATGWRPAWREVSYALLVATPIAWLLASVRRPRKTDDAAANSLKYASNASLAQALRTSCFWTFALGISLFGLISSGVSMYLQLILEERGLDRSVFQASLAIGLFAGLGANILGGWTLRFFSPAIMQAAGLLVLALSLASLPLLQSAWQAYLQAAVSGRRRRPDHSALFFDLDAGFRPDARWPHPSRRAVANSRRLGGWSVDRRRRKRSFWKLLHHTRLACRLLSSRRRVVALRYRPQRRTRRLEFLRSFPNILISTIASTAVASCSEKRELCETRHEAKHVVANALCGVWGRSLARVESSTLDFLSHQFIVGVRLQHEVPVFRSRHRGSHKHREG